MHVNGCPGGQWPGGVRGLRPSRRVRVSSVGSFMAFSLPPEADLNPTNT